MKYRDDGRPQVSKTKLKRIMQRKATLQGPITGGTLPPYVRHLQLTPDEPPPPGTKSPPSAEARARKAALVNRLGAKGAAALLKGDAEREARKARREQTKGAPTTPAPTTGQNRSKDQNLSQLYKERAAQRKRAEAERHARWLAEGHQTSLQQGGRAGPTARKPDAKGNSLGPSNAYTWAQRNDFGDWRER